MTLQPTAEIQQTQHTVKSVSILVVVDKLSRKRYSRTIKSAISVILFVAVFFLANFCLGICMDTSHPELRDPEYGRRLKSLKQLQKQHIVRSTTIILGSSRVAMGFRPCDAMNSDSELLFNFAQVGSGPIMQLMTLRRLLADGVRPTAIVCEYWPAFLRQDSSYSEEGRIDKHRLLPIDVPFIQDYFESAEHTIAIMRHVRWRPCYEHRIHFLSQLSPGWLPYMRRLDGAWCKLDQYGWLPGFDADRPASERLERIRLAQVYYAPLFAHWQIHSQAVRAIREIISLCKQHGISLSWVWLPESSEFRSFYPESVQCESEAFWASLHHDFATPLIDARSWVPDHHLADGFHLTLPGAKLFSRQFGDAIRNVTRP
jgi:hypothetical protein